MVFEIVSVGQCDGVRCLFVLIFTFFPLATKLMGPRTGCQFFKKNVYFSVTYALNLANGKHFCFFTKVKISQIQYCNVFYVFNSSYYSLS